MTVLISTLDFPCPYCGALPQEPCVSAKTPGNPTASMHDARLASVREAKR